jgi:hypothetical protein
MSKEPTVKSTTIPMLLSIAFAFFKSPISMLANLCQTTVILYLFSALFSYGAIFLSTIIALLA